MSKKIPDLQIPFTKDGRFLPYAEEWRELEWRENYTFDATMEVTGFMRGRSAARWRVVDKETSVVYDMFMSEFNDMMKQTTIKKGVVSGNWTFCKKGSNYSIRWLGKKCQS